MKILIGTNNDGKFIEIGEALSELPISLVKPADVGVSGAPDETGKDYAENALIKASYFFQQSGLPTIADDSGIVIEALENELGVHTRRWGAGADADDQEWIEHLLKVMSDKDNKRAHFICCIAHIDEHGNTQTFEGRCSGMITDALEADYLPGLPISACFKPDGFDRVYSSMTLEEKNQTSHRGRAVQLLHEHLKKILSTS